MKQYKTNERTVLYGFADPEAAAQRRKHRCTVIPDKKKEAHRKRCRSNKNSRAEW